MKEINSKFVIHAKAGIQSLADAWSPVWPAMARTALAWPLRSSFDETPDERGNLVLAAKDAVVSFAKDIGLQRKQGLQRPLVVGRIRTQG